MQQKRCSQCEQAKDLSEFWNNKRTRDRRDKICISCREENRTKRETSPAGIYELQSRLITAIFRPIWFPVYDSLWQLDHKFSIQAGFENDVPLNLINNRNNLDLILKSENLRKGSGCSITLDELYETNSPDEKLDYWCNKIGKVQDRDNLKRWSQIANAVTRSS